MATTIKIGHASISEQGTLNGTAGDSTGREVYINENYDISSLNPNVVLRPKTATLADMSARACEAGCNNNHIGYSQNGRNTLYNLVKDLSYDLSTVTVNCNTDCSAFMAVCALAGGARITYGTNAPTTTNMRARFKQSGDYIILTDTKYTTKTDYLKRGDILVKEGRHTVMVLANGSGITAEETPGIVTPIISIRNYKIDITVTDIKATSAKVKIEVKEQLNEIEESLEDISKWHYQLTLKTLPSLQVSTHQITNNEIILSNLTAGSSYMVQVNALKANETIAFCSECLVFTTEAADKTSTQHIEFGEAAISEIEPINKIYIKIQNNFKPAILYKNN